MAKIPNDIFVAKQHNSTHQSILIMTANDTQDLEFFYPYYRLIEDGFTVDVITPEGGELKCKNGMGLKETMKIEDVDINDYELLYIPGGKAPGELKKNDAALKLTRNFAASGKPIAAICHGPQVLAAAGVVDGFTISAWPEVEAEIVKAGGKFLNEETVTDGQFITARWPGDLPAHLACTLERLKKGFKANKNEPISQRRTN